MSEIQSEKGNKYYQILKELNGEWKNIPDIKKKIPMNEQNLRKILKHFEDIQVIKSLKKLSKEEQKEVEDRIKRDIRSNENYYQINQKGQDKLEKFDEACLDADTKNIFNFGLKWKKSIN
jgi:DNA-binding PadR family transcriptional regulator